jgi:hypothetical protein
MTDEYRDIASRSKPVDSMTRVACGARIPRFARFARIMRVTGRGTVGRPLDARRAEERRACDLGSGGRDVLAGSARRDWQGLVRAAFCSQPAIRQF